MAIQKVIVLASGKYKEYVALDSSAGAGSAGNLVALDAGGKINTNMMPAGIGPESVEITAAEALAQWDIVNIYLDVATLKARKADAGVNKYVAHAYCPAAIDNAATGNVYTDGLMTLSGMTPGADQYLSATPGERTETPVTGAGKINQKVGWAMSATIMCFSPEREVELLA